MKVSKKSSRSLRNSMKNSQSSFYKENDKKPIKHALMHLDGVRGIIESIEEKMEIFKTNKENYKTIVNEIQNKGTVDSEKILDNLHNTFEQIYQNFNAQEAQQKLENEKLQQKIVELKKEKTELQQLIINCAKKCSELEEDLGTYPIE